MTSNVSRPTKTSLRKATKEAIGYVIEFLRKQGIEYRFKTQKDLAKDVQNYLKKTGKLKDGEKGPDQSTISRAKETIMSTPFKDKDDDKGEYYIVKEDNIYQFKYKSNKLTSLFKLRGLYLKNSVHILSPNTLVFCIAQNRHNSFIKTINEDFSPNMLWDYYSKGNLLFLLFDSSQPNWEKDFSIFCDFFKTMEEYKKKEKAERIKQAEHARLMRKYGDIHSYRINHS